MQNKVKFILNPNSTTKIGLDMSTLKRKDVTTQLVLRKIAVKESDKLNYFLSFISSDGSDEILKIPGDSDPTLVTDASVEASLKHPDTFVLWILDVKVSGYKKEVDKPGVIVPGKPKLVFQCLTMTYYSSTGWPAFMESIQKSFGNDVMVINESGNITPISEESFIIQNYPTSLNVIPCKSSYSALRIDQVMAKADLEYKEGKSSDSGENLYNKYLNDGAACSNKLYDFFKLEKAEDLKNDKLWTDRVGYVYQSLCDIQRSYQNKDNTYNESARRMIIDPLVTAVVGYISEKGSDSNLVSPIRLQTEFPLFTELDGPPGAVGWGKLDYFLTNKVTISSDEHGWKKRRLNDDDETIETAKEGDRDKTVVTENTSLSHDVSIEAITTLSIPSALAQHFGQMLDALTYKISLGSVSYPVCMKGILTTGHRWMVFEVVMTDPDTKPVITYHGKANMRVFTMAEKGEKKQNDPDVSGLLNGNSVSRDSVGKVMLALFFCLQETSDS